MKKTIYRILVFSLIIAMLSGFAVPAYAAAGADSIGSLLDSFQNVGDQVFHLNSQSRFYVLAEKAPTGSLLSTVQLVQRQFAADGHVIPIVWGPEDRIHDGDILINLNSGCGLIADGYQWEVGTVAKLTAPDTDGILYGMNTLQKMIRACGSSIQGFTAKDEPDTRERTVQLDTGRKYFSKEWICNFVREMSWMGYNTLSLHFSEDGGFRADIWDENYYVEGKYMPENDFSWLAGSKVQNWVHDPFRNDPQAGKYLTASELKEIFEVCKLYHIDVIPSFDSPAHMDYLTWKFEQNYLANPEYTFTYNGTTYAAKDTQGCINYGNTTGSTSGPSWPGYAAIEVRDSNERGKMARAFVFSLYEDIADFFKTYAGSTKFSICCDEVILSNSSLPKDVWVYEDFIHYVNGLNRLLRGKGYTVRMFNDFVLDINRFDSNIEILYWNAPYDPTTGSISQSEIPTVAQFSAAGRTLYNCIQTNTYFVLRVTSDSSASTDLTDARSPDCKNWTIGHSDEDSIYDEWYPADISEHGKVSQDVADVPVAGGYFLLWNDYASVATESEVWNGVDNFGKWNVIDRMWSNIIKMWNADVNNTVDYNSYAAVRSKFGYFPGYSTCSARTNLPGAVSVAKALLADHTELTAALQTKIAAEGYTTGTYAMYEAAYAKAESLNKNADATAEEMEAAIAALEEARKNLVFQDQVITIQHKTKINGKDKLIQTDEQTYENGSFNVYIPKITGYTYLSCEGATYTPLDSDDGSGHISGSSTKAVTVTIWYENTPYTGKLGNLVEEAITDEETYTPESWAVYEKAVNAAKAFTPTETTTQADIDKLVKAIVDAQNALVAAPVEFSGVLTVEKLTALARLGRQVGLRITTTADIEKLTIDGETFTLCAGCVTTLKSGETVKLWIVYFPADEAGTFTYKLHAGEDVEEFSVTVQ